MLKAFVMSVHCCTFFKNMERYDYYYYFRESSTFPRNLKKVFQPPWQVGAGSARQNKTTPYPVPISLCPSWVSSPVVKVCCPPVACSASSARVL